MSVFYDIIKLSHKLFRFKSVNSSRVADSFNARRGTAQTMQTYAEKQVCRLGMKENKITYKRVWSHSFNSVDIYFHGTPQM